MPPKSYSSYKSKDSARKKASDYVPVGPALDDYEKTLKDNPGSGQGGSWIAKLIQNAPIPGVPLIARLPQVEALLGEAETPIKNILEEGEDAPVIGPAIGATGRLFDLLSRGNYAAANFTESLQGDNLAEEDLGFLEQLKKVWQVGATIPALAIPGGSELTGADSSDVLGAFKAAGQGLWGTKKNSFGEVLEQGGVDNNLLRGASGLAMDVALDPTTYVGVGAIKGLKPGGKVLSEIADDVAGGIRPKPGQGWLDAFNDIPQPSPGATGLGEGPIAPLLRADDFRGIDPLPYAPGARPIDELTRSPGWKDSTPSIDSIDYDAMSFRELRQLLADRGLDHLGPASKSAAIDILKKNPVSASDIENMPIEDLKAFIDSKLPQLQDPSKISLAPNARSRGEVGPSSSFDPQRPFGRVRAEGVFPPVEKVVDGPVSELSTEVEQLDLFNQPAVTKPVSLDDPRTYQQVNLFDKRRKNVKAALEGVDLNKPIPSRAVEDVMGGQLAMQFPEKAQEVKWLQLFDPDTPQVIKKSYVPSQGVELLTKVDPDELRILQREAPMTAAEDWEKARAAYKADGPVETSLIRLSSHPVEGLIKAPYEVPGNVRNITDVPHRSMLTKADMAGWKGGFDPGRFPLEDLPTSADSGYLAFKLGGYEIVRSEAAYKHGRAILRPFLYSDTGARWLTKAFSMQAHLPDGLDQAYRVAQNTNMAVFDERARAIVNHLGKLTPGERSQITRAIASGENLSKFSASYTDDIFESLEEYRQLAKGLFDEMHIAEEAHGLVGSKLDNYVKRIVKKEDDPLKLAKKKKKDGSYEHSFQDLIDKGVKLETDIAEILRERMATSARILTKADLDWEALQRFGVPKNVVAQNPNLIEKFDLVKWEPTRGSKGALGHYIPRRHQEALDWFSKTLDSDKESNALMNLVDKAVGEWKYLALLTPGRHVRDTIGDIIMNAQAGVVNPRSYAKASKTLGFLNPNSNIRKIYEAKIASRAMGMKVRPDVDSIQIAGQSIPIDKMWDEIYVGSGAKSGQLSTEVQRLMGEAKGSGEHGRLKPILGPYDFVKRNVGRASDAREDWARLSHVIDYLDRNAKGPILENGILTSHGKDLATRAGESVRKWNIDYGNLTSFEQNTARRLIPFYTFMRHNIPRQLELLFTKPGFMALYPKGNNLMQGAFGTDNGDDHLLPPWIRETAPFRIQMQKQEQKGALGWLLDKFGAEPGMQVLGDPNTSMTPIGDLAKLNSLFDPVNPLKAAAQEVGSMVTPALKVPGELAFGTTIFNGAPIEGDYYKYFANQLPQSRGAYGQDPTGIARMLTGLPIRPVTEKMQDNEAYRRELEAKRLFKESMEANLPAQYRLLDPAKQRETYRDLVRAQNPNG